MAFISSTSLGIRALLVTSSVVMGFPSGHHMRSVVAREREAPDNLPFLRYPTPMSFSAASTAAAADRGLRLAVANAVLKQYAGRQERWRELPNIQALRDLAGRIRQHTLDHLDFYLDQLKASVERRGGIVHFAESAEDARRIVMGIIRDNGCRRIIKSKSMVSEEVDLTRHMEVAGQIGRASWRETV